MDEKERIETHKRNIDFIRQYLGSPHPEASSKEIEGSIIALEELEPTKTFEEYYEEALTVYNQALDDLKTVFSVRKKHEEEQAELENLRREKAERDAKEESERLAKEAKERDERIARESAERAKREAEEKARLEREAAERREAELKYAAEKAERNRVHKHKSNIENLENFLSFEVKSSLAANQYLGEIKHYSDIDFEEFQEKANEILDSVKAHLNEQLNSAIKMEKEEAKAESDRIQRETEERLQKEAEAKRMAEEQAQRKREENKKHRESINMAARDALVLHGIDSKTAENVIELVAKGEVPNVSISY